MPWKNVKKKMKKTFADFFEIPSDVLMDLPKIVLMGNLQVFIENHRGIVEYSPELVRIIVGEGEICIRGTNLSLRNITTDELLVEGVIEDLNLGK